MKLFSRRTPGDGAPLLVLHGLFGSSRNWITNAKKYSSFADVFLLDLRNHGDSPWHSVHSIQGMAEDVLEFIHSEKLEKVNILGHSMGGLVTIQAIAYEPNFFQKAIVEDIAPKDYPFAYTKELELLSLGLEGFSSRTQIEEKAKQIVEEPFIRNFLLMNLERKEDGTYRWKVNAEAIRKAQTNLFYNQIDLKKIDVPLLLIYGGKSEFVSPSDLKIYKTHFSNFRFNCLTEGDHYMHFKLESEFNRLVEEFLKT